MNKCQCMFCGQTIELVHVHGHYQCPVCKTNAMPCCDGDNCETNVLLKQENPREKLSSSQSQISIPIAIGIKS
jgi:hypothetical protein